jgi:hypothetical protein
LYLDQQSLQTSIEKIGWVRVRNFLIRKTIYLPSLMREVVCLRVYWSPYWRFIGRGKHVNERKRLNCR